MITSELSMKECEIRRFLEISPALYEGIDYVAIAQRLYSATLGQCGTDEKDVYRVFTEAVGQPMMRKMWNIVWVEDIYYDYDSNGFLRTTDRTKGGKTRELYYIQARDECKQSYDVYLSPHLQDSRIVRNMGGFDSDDKEELIRHEALGRLEAAFAEVVYREKDREATEKMELASVKVGQWDWPFLRYVIDDEMGEDDRKILMNYGHKWPEREIDCSKMGSFVDKLYCYIFNPVDLKQTIYDVPEPNGADFEDCVNWLKSSCYYKSCIVGGILDEVAAEAVCEFLPKD